MASFYTNVTVRGVDAKHVLNYLRQQRREAWVARTGRGATVVYDKACEYQDTAVLASLTAGLSEHFQLPALAALNQDDRLLWLQLYEDGSLSSIYASRWQHYCGGLALCGAFQRPGIWPLVWLLLQLPWVFRERLRHRALAALLGLPGWSVGSGYTTIKLDILPDGLRRKDLVHT